MDWKNEFRNSVPLSLCTIVHFWSAKTFSKASTMSLADFLATGTAQALFLKTSTCMRVNRYLIPSLNGDRLDRSTRSIWNKSPIFWSRPCVWEDEFFWVCVMCMRFDAPTVHCSVVNCKHHRNCRAIAMSYRPYSYQYGLHRSRFRRWRRPCRTCGGANASKLGSTSGFLGHLLAGV